MEILDRVMIAMIKLKVTLHIIQGWLEYMCNRQGYYCYGEHAVIICLIILFLCPLNKPKLLVLGCNDKNCRLVITNKSVPYEYVEDRGTQSKYSIQKVVHVAALK